MVSEEKKYLIKLGENIKSIRIDKGLTQKKLAELCDMEPPNIRRIEGGNTNPTVKTLFKIAKVFKIEIWELLKVS